MICLVNSETVEAEEVKYLVGGDVERGSSREYLLLRMISVSLDIITDIIDEVADTAIADDNANF